VAVHGVTLAPEASRYLSVTPFQTVVLAPGESKDLVVLSLKEEAWKDRILDSHLVLHTNISSMNIPLVCFHGLVETVSSSCVAWQLQRNILNFARRGKL
jgi:hypothetical protein